MIKLEVKENEIKAWYDVQLRKLYYNEACTSPHPVIKIIFPDQPEEDEEASD